MASALFFRKKEIKRYILTRTLAPLSLLCDSRPLFQPPSILEPLKIWVFNQDLLLSPPMHLTHRLLPVIPVAGGTRTTIRLAPETKKTGSGAIISGQVQKSTHRRRLLSLLSPPLTATRNSLLFVSCSPGNDDRSNQTRRRTSLNPPPDLLCYILPLAQLEPGNERVVEEMEGQCLRSGFSCVEKG